MKMNKMKSMRIFTVGIIATGLLFMSCKNDGKSKTADESLNITDVSINKEETAMRNNSEMKSDDYSLKANNRKVETSRDISYGKTGIASIKNWNSYNTLNTEMAEIKELKLNATNERVINLNNTIANLGNNIPAWLKTEEVMEDVADIQKEYKELMNEKNASEKERKENFEELLEQFDDLNEELDETVQRYIKINDDASEEFQEEMKKGKVKAAFEEHTEEIKEVNGIADYEKKK